MINKLCGMFMMGTTEVSGRHIDINEYIYVDFGLGHLHIKFEDEGVIVDAWNEEQTEIVGSMGIEWSEFEEEPRYGRWDYEHKRYTREDWQHEVAEGNTQIGYLDWVRHQKESE